nr:hypothetical protein CFP56_04119 [Quercus suber]
MVTQLLQENKLELSHHTALLNVYGHQLEQIKSDASSSRHVEVYDSGLQYTQRHQMTAESRNRSVRQLGRHEVLSFNESSRPKKLERRWRVYLAPWFVTQIWELSYATAQTGWTFQFRTFNLVPADALIFEACRDGAVSVVQTLFRDGKASPFDFCYAGAGTQSGTSVLSVGTSCLARHYQR